MCVVVARTLAQLEYVQHAETHHGWNSEETWETYQGCEDVYGVHDMDTHEDGKPWRTIREGQPPGSSTEVPFNEKELKQVKESVRQLHVRSGHPTNRALMNCLRARGVDKRVLELTKEFSCDDCKEVQQPVPHNKVSLHGTNILWHTMQMDIGQFVCGSETLHILFMCDEASRFCVGCELFRCNAKESRNATGDEIIRAVEQFWVQYHGLPNVLRCDPEGAFRSNLLAQWAQRRGVDIRPCAAEDHGQVGIIERLIKKLKDDARTLLCSEDMDPWLGSRRAISWIELVATLQHSGRMADFQLLTAACLKEEIQHHSIPPKVLWGRI